MIPIILGVNVIIMLGMIAYILRLMSKIMEMNERERTNKQRAETDEVWYTTSTPDSKNIPIGEGVEVEDGTTLIYMGLPLGSLSSYTERMLVKQDDQGKFEWSDLYKTIVYGYLDSSNNPQYLAVKVSIRQYISGFWDLPLAIPDIFLEDENGAIRPLTDAERNEFNDQISSERMNEF